MNNWGNTKIPNALLRFFALFYNKFIERLFVNTHFSFAYMQFK